MVELTGTFISFCGAGGTGKTTTAARLLDMLPGYRMLTGVSRSVFKTKGVESEADQHNLTDSERWDLQKAIQTKYLATYKELDGQRVLSDRSHLDQTAYALQYCSTALGTDDVAWIMDAVHRSFEHTMALFYFPLHRFPGQDDGMREVREGPRVQFDMIMRGVLQQFRVPYCEVPVMSVENRCKFIRHSLGRL